MAWSIPKELRKPSWRIAAVRRLVPEKISTAKRAVQFFPKHLADSNASKVAGAEGRASFSWLQELLRLGKLCGLPQPGSAQTCAPRWHWPPGGASWHPFCILYGQQIRRPSGVSRALPTNSVGTLGPLPLRFVLPFPRPLGRGCPLLDGAGTGGP